MAKETFKLTEDHIKLLSKMWVEWNDGAPSIDSKRPYGNGGIYDDVCEILGWKKLGKEDNDPVYSESQILKAEKIHLQTEIALQIVLVTKKFKPGTYVKHDEYDSLSWKLKKN